MKKNPKKVPITEFLKKLKDVVIKLAGRIKDLESQLSTINNRLTSIEKRVNDLEKKFGTKVPVIPGSSQVTTAPITPVIPEQKETIEPVESKSTGIDAELISKAKQLGLGDIFEGLESPMPPQKIPTPPPVPPIETSKKKETPTTKPAGPATQRALGIEEVPEDELKKRKDELLKALEDIDLM